MTGLAHLFTEPKTAKQRRYEAIRSVEIDKLKVIDAAKKFGYTKKALYTYIRDVKAGKLELFPETKTQLNKNRTPDYIQKQIIKLRKKDYSAVDIQQQLQQEGYKLSDRTVERVIEKAGMPRLNRRT